MVYAPALLGFLLQCVEYSGKLNVFLEESNVNKREHCSRHGCSHLQSNLTHVVYFLSHKEKQSVNIELWVISRSKSVHSVVYIEVT